MKQEPHDTTTKVIFRKTRPEGDIIAVFPLIPHDTTGVNMVCYQHVGQHGSASPDWVSRGTAPATPEEYAPLKRELESLGYKLELVNRVPSNAFAIRREAARKA